MMYVLCAIWPTIYINFKETKDISEELTRFNFYTKKAPDNIYWLYEEEKFNALMKRFFE